MDGSTGFRTAYCGMLGLRHAETTRSQSTMRGLSPRSVEVRPPNPRLLLTGAYARRTRARYILPLGRAAAPHAPAAEAQGVRPRGWPVVHAQECVPDHE